jgi:hypothetical protein
MEVNFLNNHISKALKQVFKMDLNHDIVNTEMNKTKASYTKKGELINPIIISCS